MFNLEFKINLSRYPSIIFFIYRILITGEKFPWNIDNLRLKESIKLAERFCKWYVSF